MKLFDYQKDAISHIEKYKKVLITMEGGTGKTFVAMSVCKSKKTLALVQNQELKKKWNEESICSDLIIMTYDELTKNNIPDVENVIIDESHKLSSPSSNRYKQIYKKFYGKKYDNIILLTATPVRNKEIDIWHQMRLFGNQFELLRECPTKKAFEYKFCIIDKVYKFYIGREILEAIGFNENKRDEFNTIIRPFYFGHKRFNIQKEKIFLEKPDMYNYNFAKTENCFEDETFTPVTKEIAMSQIVNSTFKNKILDSDYLEKIKFIKNLSNKFEKIVIIYRFTAEKECIIKSLNNITDDINEFKKIKNKKFYVRQISRSEGVNIENSNCMVFFSIDYSGVSFQQMHWRITRNNSKHDDVCYFYLIWKNTIEENLYDVVEGKKKKNDMIKEL